MKKLTGKRPDQLRALLSMTKYATLAAMRNPSSVIFGFIFPLIFVSVFGLIEGGGSQVDLAIKPGTSKDNVIYETILKIEGVKLLDLTESEIQDQLQKGQLAGEVEIVVRNTLEGEAQKKDSSAPASYEIKLTTSSANPQGAALANSILTGLTDKMNLSFAQVSTTPVTLKTEEVAGRRFRQIDFVLPGQLGFSLLSMGIFSTAFVLITLKQTLVIKRIFATPVNKWSILLSQAFSRMIISLAQAMVIILVGVGVFHYTLANGVFTLLSMLALCMIGLLVFLGFGLVISSIAKDENAVPPIANLITLPQFLLAGTFFPIELFPEWLQPVSRALPLTYLNEAMRKVAFEGQPLTAVGSEIGMLLLWGVVIYALAIKVFKWN